MPTPIAARFHTGTAISATIFTSLSPANDFKSLAGVPNSCRCPIPAPATELTVWSAGKLDELFVPAFTKQVIELHRTRKLRVLAVASPKRTRGRTRDFRPRPRAGFPGLISVMSLGPFPPAGTPRPIIEQIAAAYRKALAEPAYQAFLIDGAFEPVLNSDAEKFRASLAADVKLWAPLVASLGLKID